MDRSVRTESRETISLSRTIFVQKDLDTVSRARADLHATLAQIRLHIDDDAIGEQRISEKAKSSVALPL